MDSRADTVRRPPRNQRVYRVDVFPGFNWPDLGVADSAIDAFDGR